MTDPTIHSPQPRETELFPDRVGTSRPGSGHPIIVRGAFRLNDWVGRTDILRRIETPSDLGAWSYEVIDAKRARETKGGTVLQLFLYAELVASVQGMMPAFSYVVIASVSRCSTLPRRNRHRSIGAAGAGLLRCR